MNRRPLMVFCLLFLIGIVFSHTFSFYLIAAAAGIILYYFLTAGTKKIILLRCVFFVVSFALGFIRGNSAIEKLNSVLSETKEGETLTVCAAICGKEEKKSNTYYYLDTDPGVIVISEDTGFFPGDRVDLSGEVRLFSTAENEGNFDEKSYYSSKGCAFFIIPEKMCLIRRRAFSPPRFFAIVKERMIREISLHLPAEEAGLMSAITLGDRSDMDEDIKDMFSVLGLFHIAAVSGMHISAVAAGLYKGLRRVLSFLISGIFAGGAAISYCIITGIQISGMRASFMFIILMISAVLGEAYDPLTSLSLTGMIVSAVNPMAVTGAAYILSFGVSFGIFIFVLPLLRGVTTWCRLRWERTHKKEKGKRYMPSVPGKICMAFLFSFLIQVISLPLSLYNFYTLSPYTTLLNLIILPILPILLVLGLIGISLCILLPGAAGYMAGEILFFPCHIILYLYEWIIDHAGRLPHNVIYAGRPSVILICIYYVTVISMALYLNRKRKGYEYSGRRAEITTGRSRKRPLGTSEKLKILLPAFFIIISPVMLLLKMPSAPEITMLSVGQGECVLISEGYTHVMIDGGSTSVKEAGKYRILPYLKYKGIGKIDYCFITHMDEDHLNGIIELLNGRYLIGCIVVSYNIERNENYDALILAAKENGTDITEAKKGDVLHLPEGELRVLYPGEKVFTGGNENSLVCLYTTGEFDALFTGDIGKEQERYILSEYGSVKEMGIKDGKLELLKAAHHGSNGSNSMEWLRTLSPETTVISAGKNNTYGHPGRETMDRLKGVGTVV
nr:ComEC/Rec2 family competence protein [Lachnospiraceae bacterium]